MTHIYTPEEMGNRDKELWHPLFLKRVLRQMRVGENRYTSARIYSDDTGISIHIGDSEKRVRSNTDKYMILSDFAKQLISSMAETKDNNVYGSIDLCCEYSEDENNSGVFTLVSTSCLKLADENKSLGYIIKRFGVSHITADIESEIAGESTPSASM